MKKKVVILQPRIQHYRVPVFDELRAKASQEYDLEIWGTMRDGEVIGGGARDFFRDVPLTQKTFARRTMEWWDGVRNLIGNANPSAVVCPVYPSNLSCWTVPKFCRKNDIACIGWGKVYGKSDGAIAMLMKRQLFNRFDRMLVYGDRSLQELCGQLGYAKERVFVTKNTIDTSRIFLQRKEFQKQAIELRKNHQLQDAKVILCVAKLEKGKRHQDLFDAWPALREISPDLHLVLIGSGSMEQEIRMKSAKDPERIHFLGRVAAGEDYTWIAAADITVQCGAVGLAVNQSLAFGKPTVIADEISPDTEALRGGQNGWRYRKGDPASLVQTIQSILADPVETKVISERGPDTIRNEFSISHMVNRIHDCITDALKDQRN